MTNYFTTFQIIKKKCKLKREYLEKKKKNELKEFKEKKNIIKDVDLSNINNLTRNEEKKYFESLINEYSYLIEIIEKNKKDNLENKMKNEIENYQNDFMKLNCEIQNKRIENESLIQKFIKEKKYVAYIEKENNKVSDAINFLKFHLKNDK